MDDPWAVLGLTRGAPLAAARRARRALAKEAHPDTGAGSTVRMTALNDAVERIAALLAEVPVSAVPVATVDPRAEAVAAFSIGVLPVEAFEALVLVVVEEGDVVDADEPYLLEVALEPSLGGCVARLELAPEAGGTIVTVEVVGPRGAGPFASAADVVDGLVARLAAAG